MALQSITVDPNGGTIYAEIRFPTPQVVAYRLELFKANSNDRALAVNGNNQNPADDMYALPGTADLNRNRIVWCTCAIIDPVGAGNSYQVDLAILQRDRVTNQLNQLGVITASGTTNNTHITEVLAVKLM